jgi:hypothetical protein
MAAVDKAFFGHFTREEIGLLVLSMLARYRIRGKAVKLWSELLMYKKRGWS